MTISTTIIKNSYDGDGSQLTFQYNFKILNEGDIEVIIRSADGTESVKTISTDYTVTGVNEATGGNVIFVSTAPTATEKVILRRATEQTQSLDLVENDPFTADSVEGAFDRSIAIAQELQEGLDRSLKISRTNSMSSTEFTVDAAERAGKVLGFDAAGELSVAQSIGIYRNDWTTAQEYDQRDLVKDPTNDNIYLCLVAHTSSGSAPIDTNVDTAKWELIVDAAAAAASIASAEAARDIAIANAALTTVDATTASNAATNAVNYRNTAVAEATKATNAATSAAASQTAAAASATTAATEAADAAASAASAAASAGGGVVKVTINDTNANTLSDKLTGGLGIKLNTLNAGGDEQLVIASDAIAFAIALG